jgi:hypothetical protein
MGFGGLAVLEANLVHCGASRDAARAFDTGRAFAHRRAATGLACLAFAAWIHTAAAASAGVVLAILALADRLAGWVSSMMSTAASAARARAFTEYEPARRRPSAVKAAGLELAFARRLETTLDRAAPFIARGALANALGAKLRVGGGPAMAFAAAAAALVVSTPAPGEFATLLLLCARAGAALTQRALGASGERA